MSNISKESLSLSIRLMSYNHAEFIDQAMEGVLIQKTNFPVEVVVGDDFSTDGTLEKIRTYKNTENITIRILKRKKNDDYWRKRQEKGRLYNFQNIIENCRGKYIALLDGDDYWTDPLKLQKQVDFLESHPSYSVCFTNALIINEINNEKTPFLNPGEDKTFGFEKILKGGGGLFPTASLVFRNIIKYPDSFSQFKSGDRLLSLLLAEKGNFYLLNDTTCAYRRHEGGIFSSIRKNKQKRLEIDFDNIRLLHRANAHFQYKYDKLFKKEISMKAKKALLKVERDNLWVNFRKNYQFLNLRDLASLTYNLTFKK